MAMAFRGIGSRDGSIAGFNPTQPNFGDKLGLIGDILTGNPVTKNRLDEDYAFQQAQYQAQHPAPMNVGGNLVQFDPATGTVKTLYSAPSYPAPISRTIDALNTFKPGLGDTYATNYASNGGGVGPATMVINGQTMMRAPGSAATPSGPPDAAVAYLRANPTMAGQFDAKYGVGSSARYLGSGGAAPTAQAPFHPISPLPAR